jgi:F-type H+-transporting ATPase subunit b
MTIARSKLVGFSVMLTLFTSVASHAVETGGASKGAGAAFPPFDASTFVPTLFWLFVVFVTLYWLMSRVALPRVSDTIDKRNAIITRDVDQASALQKKAEEAGAAYEAALSKAKANAVTIGQKAKDDAALNAASRRKEVEADMAVKIAAAEANIIATKDKAMSNVSSIASDAASVIVQHLTGTVPNAETISKAISSSFKL